MNSDRVKIFKNLIKISAPIMLTSLLQSLYNIVDMFFLGKLGKEAVSAPSITFSIFYFFVVFGMAFSGAGTTVISQAFGNKENREKIGFLTSQTFIVTFAIGLIFTFFSYTLSKQLLYLIRVPEGLIFENTYNYYRLIALGLPLSFIPMIFASVFRGIGNTKMPLLIQAISVIINIVLDPILIFHFDMGVTGAAHATNISKLAASLVSIVILFVNNSEVRIRIKEMKFDKNVITMLMNIGLYAALGNAISAVGFTVLQGFINNFGTATIAAFAICNKINQLFMIPAMAIGQAVGVLVGQCLGSDREDNAVHTVNMGMLLCSLTTGIGMGFLFFNGASFIKIFIDNVDVIAVGVSFFRHITFSVFLFSLFVVFTGAFQGGGVTKPILIFAIIRLWGIRVPFAYILPSLFNMGINGLWYALILSNLIVSIVAYIMYRKGSWKNKLNIEGL